MNETERLNMQAASAIRQRKYHEAIQAVEDGSGDVKVLALLAIAKELSAIYDAIVQLQD